MIIQVLLRNQVARLQKKVYVEQADITKTGKAIFKNVDNILIAGRYKYGN